MADKISVSYDANIDEMKRKLEELIGLNDKLAQHAFAAAKAIGAIADAKKGMSGNIKIVYQDIVKIDNSIKTTNDTILKFGQATKNAAGGLGKIDNSINTTTTKITHFDNSVKSTVNTVNSLDNSIRGSFNTINKIPAKMDLAEKSVSKFDAGIAGIGKAIGAVFVVDKIVQFAKELIQLEREFEMIQNRMNFVFDTTDRGEAGFERLRNLSIRLGLDVKETANAFSTFGIAAKMAGFSSEDSETIFKRVAVSLRGAGANSLQTSRSFYALQQMLSKGVVSAEELRRQLGESLPGASDLMAEAYQRLHPEVNVTNAMFNKLLESGKIMSAEILPEFSKVLEETFSPAVEAKMKSLDAAINRLNNAFESLKLTILDAQFVAKGTNFIADYVDNIAVVMRSNMPTYQKFGEILLHLLPNLPFAGFFGLDRSLAQTAQILREREAEIQRMEDLANKIRDRYIKSVANRFLELNDGSFTKAIQAQGRLLRQEMAKTTKDLTEQEMLQRETRLENARLVLSELNKMQTQAESSFQDNKEAEEKAALDARKAEIAAAKELLAAEETRLLALTEGTTAYYNQLVKVIDAQKNLAKIELRDRPRQRDLEIAKLDKELEKARKMADEKLDKENRKQTEQQLELAVVAAKKIVETTKEGTQERANAEKWLALEVAELEKFKVTISTDSEELKAEKIALINEELKNKLKKIDLDYAKDQKETQDKIVEGQRKAQEKIADIIQKANDLIEKTQLDTYRRRRAIVKQQFEAMANDIKEAMSQTGDFEALAQLAKALSGVEQAGKKAISSLDLNQVGEVIDDIGGLYSAVAGYQSTLLNNEAILLKEQLDQKLISEEEYNRKSLELEKKRFEQEKKVATLEATINAASGIVKAIAQQKYWQAALITATLAAQIAAIQSQQFPGFKDGVIDINGPGTGTSDSIPARLSRGESVMTADETRRYKPVLQAIRDNNFEEFVSKRYIDAMGSQNVSSAVGNSFAENLTNSFDLQTAELAHLLKQNRKVAIKNVDELAKAMSRRNTTEKVINRRRFK
jgi:tape measure domain-containing protein